MASAKVPPRPQIASSGSQTATEEASNSTSGANSNSAQERLEVLLREQHSGVRPATHDPRGEVRQGVVVEVRQVGACPGIGDLVHAWSIHPQWRVVN